jgi:molecular chaperone HtpG
MLQSDRHVRQIRRTLTKKVLDALKKMLEGDRAKYETFWRELGRAVKEGVDSDFENRDALLGLLLFGSSREAEALGTLKEYVERMPEGQKDIWYLTGSSARADRELARAGDLPRPRLGGAVPHRARWTSWWCSR